MTTLPTSSCAIGGRSENFNKATRKPRIAIFSLTGCEGCSLAILELEDDLLALLGEIEIVNFREAMSESDWDIDIGFVDGAVSTPHDESAVKTFREACKTLVAAGACACLGGINTLKHHQPQDSYREVVYGSSAKFFPTTDARPIRAVVTVEYELPGCPMVKEEFLRFVKCMLAGRPVRLPTYPVCVECKRRGILCLYERGVVCLGPATRAGCNAICPLYGAKCEGCRGLLGPESLSALGHNLAAYHAESKADAIASLRLFGAHQEGDVP
jgi:coenzyme F420-reducing hydrogenase gamma subunit